MPNHWHLLLWPAPRRGDWVKWVNAAQTQKELSAIGESLTRGRPYGDALWQTATAAKLNLSHTFRPRGRPKKPPPGRMTEGRDVR